MITETEAFARFVDLTAKYLEDIEKLSEEFPPLKAVVDDSPLAETKELVKRARQLSDVMKEDTKNAN